MVLKEETNKVLKGLEARMNEKINKGYSDLFTEVNNSLKKILETTMKNAEHLEEAMKLEIVGVRKHLDNEMDVVPNISGRYTVDNKGIIMSQERYMLKNLNGNLQEVDVPISAIQKTPMKKPGITRSVSKDASRTQSVVSNDNVNSKDNGFHPIDDKSIVMSKRNFPFKSINGNLEETNVSLLRSQKNNNLNQLKKPITTNVHTSESLSKLENETRKDMVSQNKSPLNIMNTHTEKIRNYNLSVKPVSVIHKDESHLKTNSIIAQKLRNIEKVLGKRINSGGKLEYLVKYKDDKGNPSSCWHQSQDLSFCNDLIDQFENRNKAPSIEPTEVKEVLSSAEKHDTLSKKRRQQRPQKEQDSDIEEIFGDDFEMDMKKEIIEDVKPIANVGNLHKIINNDLPEERQRPPTKTHKKPKMDVIQTNEKVQEGKNSSGKEFENFEKSLEKLSNINVELTNLSKTKSINDFIQVLHKKRQIGNNYVQCSKCKICSKVLPRNKVKLHIRKFHQELLTEDSLKENEAGINAVEENDSREQSQESLPSPSDMTSFSYKSKISGTEQPSIPHDNIEVVNKSDVSKKVEKTIEKGNENNSELGSPVVTQITTQKRSIDDLVEVLNTFQISSGKNWSLSRCIICSKTGGLDKIKKHVFIEHPLSLSNNENGGSQNQETSKNPKDAMPSPNNYSHQTKINTMATTIPRKNLDKFDKFIEKTKPRDINGKMRLCCTCRICQTDFRKDRIADHIMQCHSDYVDNDQI